MLNNILKSLKAVTLLIVAVSPLLAVSPALAASASMSLSRSGSTVKGGTLVISIRENSGAEPVNSASATITYPTSLLSYISVSNSGAFGISAATSGGGGSVHVERGALPAVSGSQTIASVSFRVLASSGTATISLTSGQVLSANSNANIASGFSGTSAVLSAPAAPTPAAPAPPKDTIPPKITSVSASAITYNSVTINWTTSEPATSVVDYGPSKAYGLSATDGNLVTAHKVILNSALIVPGTEYHYAVKSADGAGNAAAAPDATFTTVGAKITITVLDQNKKALKGAKVQIDDQTAATNAQGKADLQGLSLGKKYGFINYHGDKYPFTTNITTAASPLSDTAKLTVKPNYTLPAILIVLLLLVLDFLVGWRTGKGSWAKSWFNKIRDRLPFDGPGSPGSSPPASSSGSAGATITPSSKK